MILGHPALRLLLRLKLRGAARRQGRRLRKPAGILFALLGLLIIGAWLSVLVVGDRFGSRGGLSGPEQLVAVQTACFLFCVLTVAGAFSHRGLYMPREEIELLLASPVPRSDLVRYRLLAGVGRALFGGLIVALMTFRMLPHPFFGFAGVFLATMTLPLLGQAVSLLAGDAENRVGNRIARLPLRWVQGVLAVLVGGGVFLFASGIDWSRFWAYGPDGGFPALLRVPWLAPLTAAFRPWARLVLAADAGQFALWGGVCALLWVAGFELVARIPIDFRELSLATSADVARRLNRRRLGAGASSSEASRGTVGWRVPWLFGRGPFGAIAWRKSCSMLRKARGTLFTSALILGVLTVASIGLIGERERGALLGSVLIAVVGTLYLCAGLRFDFREDLEQMETIKSWPLPAWRLFLATILPEVALVSGLLALSIGARAAFTGEADPWSLAVVAAIPLLVLTWTAIDNAVFLYAPVRYTPGQEGALHHAGRAVVLMLVRLLAFNVVLAGCALAVWLAYLAREPLELGNAGFAGLALALCALVVLVLDALLIRAGGWIFQRFDVARDRG